MGPDECAGAADAHGQRCLVDPGGHPHGHHAGPRADPVERHRAARGADGVQLAPERRQADAQGVAKLLGVVGTTQPVAALSALAESLARAAGAVLIAGLASSRAGATTKSSATDVVTSTDLAAEALIVARLKRERPDDAILAEEGTDHDGVSGMRWVIDPLDGTTNFFYGHPGFAVSIAVQDDRGGLVGVVFDPLSDELFTARRGGGAFCNGQALRCRDEHQLELALVATGFAYRVERRAHQGAVVAALLPQVRDIRRLGSAALDLCRVAAGRVDAYYEAGLAPWDLAAGALIAAEAGALVTGFAGGPPSGEGVLAANPFLHPLLADALAAAERANR